MNYSPYKPFRLKKTFNVDTYNNDYVEYTIQFGRYNKYITQTNQWVTVYRGKSLVINRYTEVDVSTVVRDYAYRKSFEYDYEQGFKPSNLLSTASINIENIEMGGDVANTVIRVNFYYNETDLGYTDVKFSIYGQENTPYDGLGSVGVYLYQDSKITNHVPLIYTENYWVSFDYAKYVIQNTMVTTLIAGTNSGGFKINNANNHGNFSEALTLKDIYDSLNDDVVVNVWYGFGGDVVYGGSATATGPSIRIASASIPSGADVELWYGYSCDVVYGGSATVTGPILRTLGAEIPGGEIGCGDDILFGYQLDTNTPIFNDVLATVDCCPDEWYLSWNDSKGWHSVGLRSAWEVDENERFNIVNIYDEERNVRNTISKTFKVQSKKLNAEELNEYYNILESTYVVLYNSREDRNYFCNLVNTSVDRTKKKDQKFFECEIKEIINSIN